MTDAAQRPRKASRPIVEPSVTLFRVWVDSESDFFQTSSDGGRPEGCA